MVAKARDDFPDPERPVITVNLSLGISREISLRLFSLAPLIIIDLFDIVIPILKTGAHIKDNLPD
jgi:hypothetical protein